MNKLDALYAQSQQLTHHIVGAAADETVGVERGLRQMDAQVRRLVGTTGTGVTSSSTPTAAFLLANRGLDADRAAREIAAITPNPAETSTANAFTQNEDPESLDLHSFLAAQHQSIIASAIDSARKDATRDARIRAEKAIARDWANSKKRVFAEIGGASSSSFGPSQKTPMKQYSAGGPQGGLVSHSSSTPLRQTHASMAASTPSSSSVSLQMMSKHRVYASALQSLIASTSLSSSRIKHFALSSVTSPEADPFLVFGELSSRLERGSASSGAGVTATSHISKCWKLLSNMFSHSLNNGSLNLDSLIRGCRDSGTDGLSGSDEAISFRKRIVEGGKQFLHEIYWDFLQQIVAQNRIQIGGLPTVHTIIDAYIQLKFSKNGNFSSTSSSSISPLEVISPGGIAPWAHIFYLLRCGLFSEALEYVSDPQGVFVKSNADASRFASWLRSFIETGAVSNKMRVEIEEEWNARIRPLLGVDAASNSAARNNPSFAANTPVAAASGQMKVDAFKAALYKILGRCDMGSKTLKGASDVAPSVEDYLWVQLMLVREDVSASSTGSGVDRYTLRDMSRVMRKFGDAHFSPGGRSPHVYFLVLLLVGEFERAVAFLFSSGGGDVSGGGVSLDAVHFGIALAMRGMLRVPENPRGFDGGSASDVLVTRVVSGGGGVNAVDGYEAGYFLLAKLCYGYAKLFYRSDPVEALHYLLVLGFYGGSLGSDNARPASANAQPVSVQAGKEYTSLLHAHVRELILVACRSSAGAAPLVALLGESATYRDIRSGGELEKHALLLHAGSAGDIVKFIIIPAAKEAEHKGLLSDAIRLFDYAEAYDVVVGILCKQLSDVFVSGVTAALQQSGGGQVGGLASLYSSVRASGSVMPASPGQYRPSAGAMSGFGVSVMDASSFAAGTASTSNAGKGFLSAATEKSISDAAQILNQYSRRPAIQSHISELKRHTSSTLLKLHHALTLFASDKFEEAIEAVRSTRLIPFEADMTVIMRMVADFRALDETVAKCLPHLMLMLMEMLVRVYRGYQEGVAFSEAMRVAKMQECTTTGRSLILYAGNIQYRVPSDIFAKLNRLEVLMN
ncbi:hypothetical protein HDU78_008934 [Chytriomyces hyalinus]|nr:hypothetical protein HDU78_008934 [Chytriomyces hyalinus]